MYANLRNRDYTGSADDYQLAGYTIGDPTMIPYDQPAFPETTPGFSQGARVYRPTSFPVDAIPYHEIIHQTGEQLDGEFQHMQASFTDPDFVAMLLPQQIENEKAESVSILQPRLDLEDLIQKHVTGLLSDQKAMDQLKDQAYQLKGASEYEKREFLQNLITNQMSLGASANYERMHRSIAQYFGISPEGPTRPPVVPRPPTPPLPPGAPPPPPPPPAIDPDIAALAGFPPPPDPRETIGSRKIAEQMATEMGEQIPPEAITDPFTSGIVGGQIAEDITRRNVLARQARRLREAGITPEALARLPMKEASQIAQIAESDPARAASRLAAYGVAPTLPVPDPSQAERIIEEAQARSVAKSGILASSSLQQFSADQALKAHEDFLNKNPQYRTGDVVTDFDREVAFRKAQAEAAAQDPAYKMYAPKESSSLNIRGELIPTDDLIFVSSSGGTPRPKQTDMKVGQVYKTNRGITVVTGRGPQGGFQGAYIQNFITSKLKGEIPVSRPIEYTDIKAVTQKQIDAQILASERKK